MEPRVNRALLSIVVLAAFAPVTVQAQLLAFPEAEGFGRYATGARTNLSAASVYHVTNLNDSGAGSFRDAVSQSNRFVVFDVGGIVTLNSVLTFGSNITIAGQTAPGGFVVYGDRVAFHGADNLISRHWAVRKGRTSDKDDDAASLVRGHDMIFDHMSITWGTDGTFDMNHDSGQVIDNITVQNSIIAQGLDHVGHSTGGLIQPGEGGSTSFIKNLWADNVTRNPKVRRENEFINNVVYDYLEAGYIMGDTDNADSYANVEGNYFIKGTSAFTRGTSRFHIYANDNWVDGNSDGILNGSLNTSYPGADVVATPHAFPTTATMSAQQAVAYVRENAGNNIVRDAVDTRLMQEVASYGTLGGIIIEEDDLFPGYGTDPSYLNPRARLTDADNDGIADNWEAAHGLSAANPVDWKGLNSAGYTWLEEYVNELGANGTTVSSAGGDWTTPATWTGGTPTLADDAVASGNLSVASGHGFARRLTLGGGLNVSGGTVDVVDTATADGLFLITGGTVTAGRMLVAAPGQSGSLVVAGSGTLQTGTVASGGGAGTLILAGGTFRAADAPNISVPTSLGTGGATIDTAGYSGAITGAISGDGGMTKQGEGSLTVSGANSYAGPTAVEAGTLVAQGAGLGQTSAITVDGGATLDVSGVSGGLNLGSGKSLTGAGTVVGSVTAAVGAVVRPQGSFHAVTQIVAVQAENLSLGSDWAVFDNAVHGTGAGGSYDGADLNGGGIVLVSGESLSAPTASGVASTTVDIADTATWYLYAKVAEPSNSPLAGDPSPTQGGNNSFWASGEANSVQASTSSYEEVQTMGNPGDAATWTLVSPSLSPLDGVNVALNAGIDYVLSSGQRTFAIYGREVGTIIDGFVLSETNLTAAQLESALSSASLPGNTQSLTVTGDYFHAAGATLAVEIDGGDARNELAVAGMAELMGDLSVSLASGFVPQADDVFEILVAGTLISQFGNAAPGARIATENGVGSFIVNYDYANDLVTLSDFAFGLPGDFNGDGIVDAADYTVWRDNLGAADESAIMNRGDGLNGVDEADYFVWRSNFGASSPAAGQTSATATPEPSSLLLIVLGVLAIAWRRSR